MDNRFSLFLLLFIFLTSCGTNHRPAPVRNLSTEPNQQKTLQSDSYQVQKTDTLYSIAFRFGIDFEQLASINRITSPYTIYPDDILQLKQLKPSPASDIKPVIRSKSASKSASKKTNNKKITKPQTKAAVKVKSVSKTSFDSTKKVRAWRWPIKKSHLKKFYSDTEGAQQGINIAGTLGEPIMATADGMVVYSGNGLVGYGNLIIIKHNQFYLSAYAHNEKLSVSEKQTVKAGQQIATMGKNNTGKVQLHFEIRYQGRPVNPLKYLPSID